MMNSSQRFVNFIFFALLIFSIPLSAKYTQEKVCYENRYAFDIGTGTVKSRAVVFNVCTNKVVETLGKFEKLTHFEACMVNDETGAVTLTPECVNRTNFDFEKFQYEYNMDCNKDKCFATATAWARKVNNDQEVAGLLKKQGIEMKVLSQEEEGEVAFKSVLGSAEFANVAPENLVVWDIGGGSFQFSTLDEKGKIHVFQGADGVESFDKLIRKLFVKPQSLEYPFFDDAEIERSVDYVSKNYGRKLAEDPVFAAKFSDPNTVLVGVGGPMNKAMIDHIQLPRVITPEIIKDAIHTFKGKTAEHVKESLYPRLPNHFLRSAQSLLIIHYGIMVGAGIEKVQISDLGLVDYVVTEKSFWRK